MPLSHYQKFRKLNLAIPESELYYQNYSFQIVEKQSSLYQKLY